MMRPGRGRPDLVAVLAELSEPALAAYATEALRAAPRRQWEPHTAAEAEAIVARVTAGLAHPKDKRRQCPSCGELFEVGPVTQGRRRWCYTCRPSRKAS